MKRRSNKTLKTAPAGQRQGVNPAQPELIFNLWYVHNDRGIILCLIIREYIVSGTDQEKLNILKERGKYDWICSRIFDVPEKYHVTSFTPEGTKIVPFSHTLLLEQTKKGRGLFDEALETIKGWYRIYNNILIHEDSPYYVTPLIIDHENRTLSSSIFTINNFPARELNENQYGELQ
jgi:hypothetical protein